MKMFLDNKILGVGVKNFRKFCGIEKYKSEKSCSTHPHNTYFELISDSGIVGLISFVIFVTVLLFKFIKSF